MTDLDAMETLRDMREHDGLRGISAVVADESTPEVLISTADYTLNGVSSVEILLDWLLSTSQGDSTTAQIT